MEAAADGLALQRVNAATARPRGDDQTSPLPERPARSCLAARARLDVGPGDMVGPYRILEMLGEGGMGTVFLAEQRAPVRRRVAVKVVKLGMDTREVVARFEAERQALALLNHPNVAAVLDAGATESGRPYFVMEYVPGIPIAEYCDQQCLGLGARLELLIQACDGIQHAHHKGIIHRDIKPGNLLVTEKDGRPLVKVIDFGIAKSTQQKLVEQTIHTRLGHFMGTPDYTSPEQAVPTLMDVDTRTDVYSLGVVLYELLVGEGPFQPRTFRGKPLQEIQRIIRETEPPAPAAKFDTMQAARASIARMRGTDSSRLRRRLKGDVAWVALHAIEKDRRRRYDSATALADDLRRYLASEPVVARAPSVLYRLARFTRRHFLAVFASLAALAGLLATSTGMTGLYFKARAAEVHAQQEARAAQQVADFLTGLFQVADPNRSRGRPVTARELLDRGAERIRHELADQPVVRARLMRTMAEIYEELSLLEPAESLGREALELYRRELGLEHPETARGLSVLGNVLESQGRYDLALGHFRHALATNEAVYGADHPEVAANLSDIGGILEAIEDYPLAGEYVARALAIDEASFGPDHPRVASDLSDLGSILAGQDRFQEALAHYSRALAMNVRALGARHPELAGNLSDIAAAYAGLGEHELSFRHYRQALAIAKEVFGPSHPEVAEVLHGLAEVRLALGDVAGAEHDLERAVAIRREYFGIDHEETLESAYALGELYQEQERELEAGRQLVLIRNADPAFRREDLGTDDAID